MALSIKNDVVFQHSLNTEGSLRVNPHLNHAQPVHEMLHYRSPRNINDAGHELGILSIPTAVLSERGILYERQNSISPRLTSPLAAHNFVLYPPLNSRDTNAVQSESYRVSNHQIYQRLNHRRKLSTAAW